MPERQLTLSDGPRPLSTNSTGRLGTDAGIGAVTQKELETEFGDLMLTLLVAFFPAISVGSISSPWHKTFDVSCTILPNSFSNNFFDGGSAGWRNGREGWRRGQSMEQQKRRAQQLERIRTGSRRKWCGY